MKRRKEKFRVILVVLAALIFKQGKAFPEILPEVNLRPNIEYKAQELKDPFAPVEMKVETKQKEPTRTQVAKPLPPPELKIQGVVWGGYFPQAIINEEVVKIGDLVEGARITGINKNGVSILFDNQEYNLSSPGINQDADAFKKK